MIEWVIESEAAGTRSQDRAALLEIGQIHLAVVADGHAGSGGGREAADAVLEALDSLRPRREEWLDPDYWVRALTSIDAALEREAKAGETTALLVATDGRQLVGASCGDSTASLFRRDAFLDLSAGQRHEPLVGSGAAVATGFGPEAFDGTLLLASGGLHHHAPFQAIWDAALLPDPHTAAQALTSLPRLPSGAWPDDVSVLLARPR